MIFDLLQEEIEHSFFLLRECIDIPYLETVLIDVDYDQSCVGELAHGIRSHVDRKSAFTFVSHDVEVCVAVFVLDAVDLTDYGCEIAERKLSLYYFFCFIY